MTKVSQYSARCIKCEKESMQLHIQSANLDDQEMLLHKQECPHCGYNAQKISISDELISYESKEKIARYIYDKLELKDYELTSHRDEEIMADYFVVPNLRGPGAIIIGDDGSYLLCQSAYSYDYHKEKYKQGQRHN